MIYMRVLRYGGRFPNFHASTILIRKKDKNIVYDPGFPGDQSTILESLRQEGLVPDDIHFIINSHHHLDHCANNYIFKNATIILHRKEYQYIENAINKPMEMEEITQSLIDYYQLRFGQARALANIIVQNKHVWEDIYMSKNPLVLVDDNTELEPGIRIIHTPGHTDGHISLFIYDEQNNIRTCIAGDALVSKNMYQVEKNIQPILTSNLDLYLKSKRIIENSNASVIIPGHDRPFYAKNKEYLTVEEAI